MTVNTTETKRQRGRKVAAILAGGLVLGVGTMATLASWNDSEFATASFTGGKFNLVGSLNQSGPFIDHPTATPGTLSFTSTFGNLQPGDTIYAPYALALGKDTSYAATVSVSAGTFNGSTTGLSYTLFTTATAGCSATSVPVTTVVSNGTALNSVGTPTSFNLAKPTAANTDGAPVYLCFKVTADTALVQGQTATPVWNFTATSGVS